MNPTLHQPGGTGIAVFNALSHKALKPGGDETGLGRWSWVRLRGTSGQVLRIVAAYRPCYSAGPLSTYQQHIRYLTANNCKDSPKDIFLLDLITAIKKWQNDGDLVIIMADMNEDVRNTPIKNAFRTVGLVEGLTTHHQRPPPTHNRGRHPIDGIFLPISLLDQCTTGYLEFSEAIPSDHRALWIDLAAHNVCSMEPEPIECPKARWLQCKDPCIIKWYNQLLLDIVAPHNVLQQIQHLNNTLHKPSSKFHTKKELNAIDHLLMEAKQGAENQCQNFKNGQVQWCLQVMML